MALQARRIGETLAQYNRRVGKKPPTTVRKPTPTKRKPVAKPTTVKAVTPTVKRPPTQKVKARIDPDRRRPIVKKPTPKQVIKGPDAPTIRTPRPKRPTVDPRKPPRTPTPKLPDRRKPPTTGIPKPPSRMPKDFLALVEELKRRQKDKPKRPRLPTPKPAPKGMEVVPKGYKNVSFKDAGFKPPPKGSATTSALVRFYNPKTKEVVIVPSGGYTPAKGFIRSGSLGGPLDRRPRLPVTKGPDAPTIRPPRRPPDTLGGSPVAIGNNIDINKIGNKSRIFEIADRKNRAIRQQLQRLVSATYRRGISPMAKAQAEAQIKIIRNQLSKVKFPKGMGGDGTYTSEMLYALGVFQKGPSRIKRPTPDQIIPMPFAETQPVRRPPDPLGGRDLRDLNRKERAEVVKARYQLTQTERMRNYNNARQNLINRFRNDPAKLRQELSKLNINIRQDDTVRKFRAGLVSRNALNNIGLPPREIQKVIFDRKMSVMPESPRKLDMILNFQIREMNLDLRETIKKMQARGATRQEIQRIRTAYRNEIARRRQNMARAKADLQAYRRTR